MKKVKLNIQGVEISATDYSNLISDYRPIILMSNEKKIDLLPKIDMNFFKTQRYVLPSIEFEENSFLLPTTAKKTSKSSNISDYQNFIVVNLDVLCLLQNLYYQEAKQVYSKNPRTRRKFDYTNGDIDIIDVRLPMRKRGSNNMTQVQFKLALAIWGDKKVAWEKHSKMIAKINTKGSDLKLQKADLLEPSSHKKGRETSFGDLNLNDELLDKYGVLVKAQNGKPLKDYEILLIDKNLKVIFDKVINLSDWCRKFGLKVSYSRDKHMHATSFAGVFIPSMRAIGISNKRELSLTLAHEFAHFIDYFIGNEILNTRYYISDDSDSLAGQIAHTFRINMSIKSSSSYQNRTIECFARAFEQYLAIVSSTPLDNESGSYCTTEIFNKKVAPLIEDFLNSVATLLID